MYDIFKTNGKRIINCGQQKHFGWKKSIFLFPVILLLLLNNFRWMSFGNLQIKMAIPEALQNIFPDF